MAVGSAGYSVPEILQALFSEEKSAIKTIVINLRLPRIILAILIRRLPRGGGRPPPVGHAQPPGRPRHHRRFGRRRHRRHHHPPPLPEPHLVGAAVRLRGRGAGLRADLHDGLEEGVDPTRIILSGVAINSVLGAYNSLLQLLNSDSLEGVLAFMNGSLSGRSWHAGAARLSVYASIGLVLAFLCIKSANALQLGDEMAKSLGVKVSGSRVLLSGVAAFLAASTVSVAGMIGVRRAGRPAHLPAVGRFRL